MIKKKPIIINKVGDDRICPPKQLIDAVADEFMDINERTTITIPNFVEPILMQPKNTEKMTDN